MRLLSSVAAVLAVPLILTTGDLPATQQPTPDKPKSHNSQPPEPKIVKVHPGDTLIKIAKQHETTHTRIFYANLNIAHPDLIHPGDEIRIPQPDEKLEERPLPTSDSSDSVDSTQPRRVAVTKPTYAPVSGGEVWDRLAQCESGGNWSINSGNGYYGGLQFSLFTWRGVGGSGYPHQASREEQIARAKILLTSSGWGAWPACSARLGLL